MQSTSDLGTLARKVGFDPAYLETFEAKMFIQGPKSARRLTNFFVLLLLATVIATFGVLSDSTATVIGAMIVAPLMGPIMATAAAIVMGSAQRALRALALVAAGVVATILLSWLLALGMPDVTISIDYNSQITSRIAPGLMALITALASGAAGAYILVIAATLLVAVPLSITSYRVVNSALEDRTAVSVANEWLADTNYEAVNVIVRDEQVTVSIEGQGDLRPLRQLAGQLAQTLERPIWVNLRIVPTQTEASDQ